VDAGPDERGSEVRAGILSAPALTLLDESFPDDPALDVAVSRAVMHRVGRGELPETLRIARPAAVVAFAKRDAVADGYAEAVAAARREGFGAILRLAGGRAAIFHEGTLEVAHAAPDPEPRAGIHERFEAEATLISRALRRLGVDARVGEVAGEYCPGRWSVNAAGRRKLAGIGQRIVAGGSHTGTVLVVSDGRRIRRVLEPVYAALGLPWDPATVGAVEDEVPGVTWEGVRAALLEEYAARFELMPGRLDAKTMAFARELAHEHRPPGL
jgi:octanoyl-[GcvH]:protein N-octanoyltransferase